MRPVWATQQDFVSKTKLKKAKQICVAKTTTKTNATKTIKDKLENYLQLVSEKTKFFYIVRAFVSNLKKINSSVKNEHYKQTDNTNEL